MGSWLRLGIRYLMFEEWPWKVSHWPARPSLIVMDKSWMLEDRRSRAYELGVEAFLKFAVENARNENRIPCPCWECGNTKDFGIGIIKGHLFSYGITRNYHNWIWHGEPSKSASNLDSRADSTHKRGPGNTHEPEADSVDEHEPVIDSDSVHMDDNMARRTFQVSFKLEDIQGVLAKWEGTMKITYLQEEIDEVRDEWAEFVSVKYL